MPRRRKWITDVPAEVVASIGPQDLADAAATVAEAEQLLREVVYLARVQGRTWQQIADVLGVTRSAAWQRWHLADPDAERWVLWSDRLGLPEDVSELEDADALPVLVGSGAARPPGARGKRR